MKQKYLKGFTLLELIIVISVMVMISSISVANFRQGERRKRISITSDIVVNALRTAQNYALSGKEIPQSTCVSKAAKHYEMRFYYANQPTLYAEDTCSASYVIETFDLPQKTQIKASGLVLNSTAATASMFVRFTLPFGAVTASRDGGAFGSVTTAVINVQSMDDTALEKAITVDGISGRIGE